MGRVDRGNVTELVGTLAEVGAAASGSPPPPRLYPKELNP